ncbi:unnamed protein product [Aspergillus oryzae]|uniref:Unnamed protein product n=1 Tax=Aspergillus oryzae var. brunneus TaxID=332754 RepID=A0ABQ6L7U8_ASPOZ|nr:unnamed protein product [Aspergillus oryzae]GMF91643.1 unnamed protein product [Aspergillus oryzae]GMG04797.1 unnamed protein product [Aspergillus oryzae]GMG51080.1 unnamed protein product [Aspergillus oryzae var. brunneus]
MASPLPPTKSSPDSQEVQSKDQKDNWVEHVQDENALDLVATYHSYEPEFRSKVEKELLRKIDARILPLIVVIYLFNYLDRNSITQARLYGLQEDTGLKGAEYQTAISIFSAGYILMQLPSTIMMTKFRPSIYLVSVSIFPMCTTGIDCISSQHV